MSTHEDAAIEAVIMEIAEDNLHDGLYYDHVKRAARLILEARRERDAAIRENERWKRGDQIESDYLTQADMQTLAIINERDALRVERDAANAAYEEMRRKVKPLQQERDAAVDCYDSIKAERDMALARETDWESEHAKLSELHDADRAALAKALERVRELQGRVQVLEAERDNVEAWYRDRMDAVTKGRIAALESQLAETQKDRDEWKARYAQFDDKDALVMDLQCRIAALEAQLAEETKEAEGYQKALHDAWARGAENERLRAEFERLSVLECDCRPSAGCPEACDNCDWLSGVREQLRAALAAKEALPK